MAKKFETVDLRTLGNELAQALGNDWHRKVSADDEPYTLCVVTVTNGTVNYILRQESDRIAIYAAAAPEIHAYRQGNAPAPSITVSATKTATQIAADIRKRMAEDVDHYVTVACMARQAAKNRLTDAIGAAVRIAYTGGDSSAWREKVTGASNELNTSTIVDIKGFGIDGIYGSMEITGEVSIRLTVDTDTAVAIASLLFQRKIAKAEYNASKAA